MLDLVLWQARFKEDMEMRSWSPCTVKRYCYELIRFFEFLADEQVTTLAEVSREVVEEYRRHVFKSRFQGRPTTARTQAGRLAGMKAFLRFLARQQYLLVDPGQGLELPRGPRTLPRVILSEAEVSKLLRAPDIKTVLGLRNRAILELLYSSAVRNAELRALDVSDVNLERLEVQVRHGKYCSERVLPIGRSAGHWLGRYLQEVRPVLLRRAEETALFVSLKHGRLSTEPLVKLVATAGEQAGLSRRVTPHTLRHSCATHMLARGASLRHLQELLGHAGLDTTQRYTRVEISDLRAIHQRFHPSERMF